MSKKTTAIEAISGTDKELSCVNIYSLAKDWLEGRDTITNNMTMMSVLEFSTNALMLIRMENDMRV